MLQRPEDQRQFARRGLEAQWHIDVVGAELDAQLAHLAAHVLVEGLDLVGHCRTRQDAKVLGELEGDAAGAAFEIGRLGQLHDGFELGVDGVAQPEIEPVLHALEFGTRQALVGEHDQPRREETIALGQIGDHFAAPAHQAIGREHEFLVRRPGQAFGALGDLGRHHLARRSAQVL